MNDNLYNPHLQTIDVYAESIPALDLTEEELKQLHEFHFYLKTNRQASLAEYPIYDPDAIEDGRTLGSIIGGIVGIGLSFVIPGLGLATGLAIGASIGGLVGAALQRPEDESKKAEKRSRPSYGITSSKALVKLGDPVPIIFTNRDRNPNGGVRLTGQLICSWIDTFKGVQKLYEQYVLSIGEIGALDTSKTLLDGQGMDNFLQNEVNIAVRSGSQTQGAMTNFPFYSQTLSPQLNTQLGLDLRSKVEEIRVQRKQTIADINWRQNMIVLRTESNCNIEKNGTANGFITTKDAIRAGKNGFVQAQILRTNRRQAIGITNAAGTPGTNPDVLPFVFSFLADGTYTVRVNNVAVTTATAYARNDIFTIEYLGNQVLFRRNNGIVHGSSAARVYPARLAVYILDTTTPTVTDADGTRINDLRVGNDISFNRGGTKVGQGTVIELKAPAYDEDEDLSNDELLEMARNETDQFNPSETYFVAGQEFRITNKNWNAATVTADRVLNLREGQEILCRWTPNIETSKKVNEVHVNLVARMFARDDKNKLVKHGVCFDCFIRSSNSGWIFVFRGLIANSSEGEIRRYFKFKNLPLDKYRIELRPLRSVGEGATIYRLGDTGGRDNQNTSAIIAGRTVQFESQIEGTATATETNKIIRFDEDEKPSVSSQQGAPIAITSINEVVTPKDGVAPRYLGFALAGVEYLASERIQTAPTPNFLMIRGIITRAHIAAGTITSTSAGTSMTDSTARFLLQTAPIGLGDTVRNLDRKLEATITAATATTITTATSLQWQTGDRYLVYRRESINYFPDIYAFVLGDPESGLGAQIDRDEWIDYPSFVAARQFCVREQYYWDGSISDLIQWRQWAAQEAIGSRLLPCRINGKFGLLPEQETPIVWLFNASNVKGYKEEWIDWSQAACNSLVVSYTDTRDDFRTKTVRIQTPEAALGLEPVREKNLQLPSVTTRTQAIRSGSVAFKSPRIQTRSISFTTGLQGCYLRPGDLIQGQHVATEWNFERSGVVEQSLDWQFPTGGGFSEITGTQTLLISVPIEQSQTSINYRAAVQYKDTGEVRSNLLCEISITGLNPNRTIKIAGLLRPLSVRDMVVIGFELESRRTYRVASVRPTEEGSIEVVGLYWHRELLSLGGITVDGVCLNGQVPYSFNRTELQTWLTGSNSYIAAYNRNTTPLLVTTDNLLAHCFHDLSLRGELPASAGTAEGQFMMAKACALAHKATGETNWLNRAIDFAQAAINFLYRSVAVPVPPSTTLFAPHWLFACKGAIAAKGAANADSLAFGRFNTTVTFTSGVGNLPTLVPFADSRCANVYAVTTGGGLVWRNVYSAPVQAATELAINYWTATMGGSGQVYRFYPSTAGMNGTQAIPTPNGEPPGRIVLINTSFNGSTNVTYSTWETTTIAKNSMMDAFPMWRSLLSSAEINCHLETLPLAYEVYELLEELNSANVQWSRAKTATAYTVTQTSNITNQSYFLQKNPSNDALAHIGSSIAVANNSNGFFATRVTTNANGRLNWIQIAVNDGVEANPSLDIANTVVQTGFYSNDIAEQIYCEVASSIASTLVEAYLSAFPEGAFPGFPFGLPTVRYSAWFITSATPSANTTKTFNIIDFVRWNTTKDTTGHFLWHPTIANGTSFVPVTTSSASGGSATATLVEDTPGGYNAVVWRLNMSRGGAGTGTCAVILNVTEGAVTNNPPSIYYRSVGSGSINYYVQDNANNWFGVAMPVTDGKWQRFTPVWEDFLIAASSAVSPVTDLPVKGVQIQPGGGSATAIELYVYYLARDSSVEPLRGIGSTFRAGLITRITTAYTFSVGDFYPIGNTIESLSYIPGAFAQRLELLNGAIDAWRGIFYMGYQSPWIWLKLGDRDRMNRVLGMLQGAQDHYDFTHVRGGFTPAYLPWLYDSAEYLNDQTNRNYWTWADIDPNFGWAGYFTRPLLEVAKLYSIEPGNTVAEQILTDAFTLMNSFYSTNNRFPTTFRQVGEPIADYHEPHIAAMIMQSAVLANVAGLDPAVSFPPIRNAYEYLRSQYVSTGVNAGSFTAGQPTFGAGGHRENFGYWVAAEIEAIACLLFNVGNLKQPC